MIYGPYRAKCIIVHDGDTVNFSLDLGFDLTFAISCRVFGINAPELNTAAGKAARDYLRTLIKPGDVCKVLSHGWDKYGGRIDGDIFLLDGRSIAKIMLETGNAVKYATPRPGVTD
jgi:endonuclease YncB( thermonuclease family)